jgi:hypothetical protein
MASSMNMTIINIPNNPPHSLVNIVMIEQAYKSVRRNRRKDVQTQACPTHARNMHRPQTLFSLTKFYIYVYIRKMGSTIAKSSNHCPLTPKGIIPQRAIEASICTTMNVPFMSLLSCFPNAITGRVEAKTM